MARQAPLKSPQEELEALLAILRAGYLTYRTGHWSVQGTAYYENHLLLQRIYEETEKQIDALGERIVGYFGRGAVSLPSQRPRLEYWLEQFGAERDPMVSSLLAAEAIQQQIKRAYEAFDPKPPLGLDDLLMGFASEKDSHIYLLRQALKGSRVDIGPKIDRAFRSSNPAPSRHLRLASKVSR
jgi:DNA-binding ferritin-like protein